MNIPPFPAHDLAKLVLGYLAEEQLMTAYDEFLSASPYLDAMRNEYDRILMTSLKTILAEYRAVKIYVETCKPHSLRRRLFGCTNLLDIFKFLVQHVDVSKLQGPEGNRGSLEGSNPCAECLSLKLSSCECKSRHSLVSANTQLNVEDNKIETSVDATPLEDLPGNHITNRKKQVKTLPKDSKTSQFLLSSDTNSDLDVESNLSPNFDHTLPNNSQNLQTRLQTSNGHLYSSGVSANSIPGQNANHIKTYSNKTSGHHRSKVNSTENVIPHKISMTGTFHDFTSGVKGVENINSNIPDSSTSENLSTHTSSTKDICLPGSTNNSKPVSKAHIFLTIGTIKTTSTCQPSNVNAGANPPSHPNHLKPKSTESKVTILSDIKVDKTFNNDSNMPAILKNATSTPLMHMQTILINGTPVYKPQASVMGPNRNFTKDEIMAMPTIIVAPTSGASQDPPHKLTEIPPESTNPPASAISSMAPSLEPLIIDVPSNSPALSQNTNMVNKNMPLLDQQKSDESEMLVKTVDTKMVSAPRDGGEPSSKNTPQVLPTLRKSSSTPRRNSHVRVLDFATPRRILQEAINENVAENTDPVEVVISRSPNLHTLADPANADYTTENDNDKTNKAADSTANSSESSKENEKSMKDVPVKKHNWDAHLRATAITNKKEDIPKSCIQPRCRPRTKTNKSKLSLEKKSKEKNVNKSTNENVSKCKNVNCKRKSDEIEEEPIIIVDDVSNVPNKPTINIIAGQDWSAQENDKNVNNKSDDIDPTDTPEMDRISLQNAIGVKLNISEFLETPYKQVLYDIQMETPRFLGPDLPGDPLSDIKIMNIPTPRFLETPKPVQATPSSYSSRPTDYSSGGSYYKPDDQDYIPAEDLEYPASVAEKENTITINVDEPKEEQSRRSKSGAKSRPVRKCTKNVSYYNSPQINKVKESDKVEKVAMSTDIVNINSSTETNELESEAKSVKKSKTKIKRSSTSKKHKSPLKRDPPKTFMKIKPRRVTPTKENIKGKVRPKKSEVQPRKRTISKEKASVTTPVVLPVSTKSRRKSSTPRKLHCTKNFTSESSGHDSPDMTSKAKNVIDGEVRSTPVPDSDTEQVQLHWSDDGSQDAKPSEKPTNTSANETEDISKIKEYIASELQSTNAAAKSNDRSSHLKAEVMKRGFDTETAKIIERDLLDLPADSKEIPPSSSQPAATSTSKCEEQLKKTVQVDTSCNINIVQEEEEDVEEYELAVSECYEGSENYITCNHDDVKNTPRTPAVTFKDKFSMEVCVDDGMAIRLRATPVTIILDQDLTEYNEEETEMAVSSISNINKLYTPMKDPDVREQVYNIFESTLTSLDTPLKVSSPKRKEYDTTVTEIILEVEKVEDREKPVDKKRKRLHSVESNDSVKRKRLHSVESNDSVSSSKRTKPEAQYLLNSANIQNIDIETVLSKLHGP